MTTITSLRRAGSHCRLTIKMTPFVFLKFVSQDPEVFLVLHSCLGCYVLWHRLLWHSFLPRVSCPGFGLCPGLCWVVAGTRRAGEGPAKAPGLLSPGRRRWRKRSGR